MKNWLFILTLLLCAALSACYNGTRNLNENTAIIHMSFKPNGLHATNDNNAGRAFVFEYTQRSLLKIDLRTLEHIPVLITKMPDVSDDGLTYTFQLRNDVKWDDGSPLTVEDVIFTTKIIVCPLTNNPALKSIFRSVIADFKPHPEDQNKFIFKAKARNNGNIELFSEIYIIQKKYWDPKGLMDQVSFDTLMKDNFTASAELTKWFENYNAKENKFLPSKLVGLGPYQVTEWEDESYITLEKKKNWWGDNDTSIINQNNPDKIIFKIIKDDASTYLAVKNQRIDASNRISTPRLIKLQQHDYFNENYYSAFTDQYAYIYIALNMKPDGVSHKPVFTDQRVRRAMAHLVNVDDIIKIFAKGKGERQASYLSKLRKNYDHSLKPIEFDLVKANQLLDEAGWKDTDGDNIRDKKINGEKIKLSYKLNFVTDGPAYKEMVLMIKDAMYKAGVEVIPNPMDFSLFYEKAYGQDFDAMLGAWLASAAYEDPTQLWHTQSWVNHGENYEGFGDAESDSLIEAINVESDPARFDALTKRLQRKIYNEQPYIFLFAPKNKILIHKRFGKNGMYVEKPNMYVNSFKLIPRYANKPTPDI